MTPSPAVDAAAVRSWMAERQSAMVDDLVQIARTESPSADPSTVGPVFDWLADALAKVGLDPELRPGTTSGGLLYARDRSRPRDRPCQLLIGHADTVWPVNTIDEMPVKLVDGRLHGPGVYDMKGGIVQIVYALGALRALGVDLPVSPVVVVSSDEEIGSQESRHFIMRLARVCARAMVMEPSLGPGGALKTARKGVGRFTVTVKGKAAHAGLDPGKGVSAILELSHVIQQLFALNDPAHGVTVNVGNIDGGLRPNVVAPESRAVVDVRVPTPQDAERVERAILGLQPMTPGAELVIEGSMGRPPMVATERNQALWRVAHDLGDELGLQLTQGMAGGGSDGNFTSLYTATLDGLGPVGDGAHAAHEQIVVDSLVDRASLLALLVAQPA